MNLFLVILFFFLTFYKHTPEIFWVRFQTTHHKETVRGEQLG